jgi:hypothetical protein
MSHSCVANLILGYEFSINYREFERRFQRFDSKTGKPKLVSETSFDFKLKFMDLNLPFQSPDEMRSESKNPRYSFEEWMRYKIDDTLGEYFKANDIPIYDGDDDREYDCPLIYKFREYDSHLYYGVRIAKVNSDSSIVKSVSLKDYDDALKLFDAHNSNFLEAFGYVKLLLSTPIEPSLIVVI